MFRIALAAVVALLTISLPALPTEAAATAGHDTVYASAHGHGVRVNLWLDSAVQPRDGLVWVTSEIKNNTGGRVLVAPDCTPVVQVQVVDGKGKVYGPAMPWVAMPGNKVCIGIPRYLKAHQAITWHQVELLEPGQLQAVTQVIVGTSGCPKPVPATASRPSRGATLFAGAGLGYARLARATVNPRPKSRGSRQRSRSCVTSSVRVVAQIGLHLQSIEPPTVKQWVGTPGHRGQGYSARISPVPAGNPPMFYEDLQACKTNSGGGQVTGTGFWQQTTGNVLHTSIINSHCHQRVWQLVAGWIGQSVVRYTVEIPRRKS